jgi:transcriptional regulator with XRE-family HTH domain
MTGFPGKIADDARRQELGVFLRSRRDRLTPEGVGLSSFGRRRAPGLRREEVAQLAGVGVTWYTWLEQGRPINASAQVLTAIGRALKLNADETRHLFMLAGAPEPDDLPESEVIAGSLAAIVAALDPLPAWALNTRYDILHWNPAQARLYGDLAEVPPHRRNLIWLLFTEPTWQDLVQDYEVENNIPCVARLRRHYAAHAGEPLWEEFIDELSSRSPTFRAMWDRYDVTSRTDATKRLNHPVAGRFRLASSSLWVADQPGVRINVYSPMDDAGHAALRTLAERPQWVAWTVRAW